MKNQKELFEHIWNTREHYSELTGEPLYNKNNSQWHWQFLHVLPKGSYPKYKLNPDNIMLALPEEHQNQNQYDKFNEKYEELRRQYYREYYGKEF